MKSKATNKIEYGRRDLLNANDIEPRNVKERITCMIDEDVVNWLRGEADEMGIGYQTLLNMKLREAMTSVDQDEKIRQVVRDELKKRA
ncbi:MAG: BrnA antitoxin family protein [Bdellovibrionaceae bacterium]|nr:BrnA antitoxin family protein [Pseudobdellovibrionaceae bacterium]